jgi:hypothetical protein
MTKIKWLWIPATLAAQPLAGADTQPPGEGVLCLGTFIYFVEEAGRRCHAGEHPEFQARVSGYVSRFDDYIIRNAEGGAETLARLKEGQGVGVRETDQICTGDIAEAYESLRTSDAQELDQAVDDLLTRDGPPRWGDCV